MKAKKLVAFILGATLVASATIGFMACKNKGKDTSLGTTTLNLSDYAVDFNSTEEAIGEKAYTKSNKVFEIEQSKIYTWQDDLLVYKSADGKYNIYNLKLEKNVLTGKDNVPYFSTIEANNSNLYSLSVMIVLDAYVPDKCTYYRDDGAELLTDVEYNSVSASKISVYLGDNKEMSDVLRISANGAGITSDKVYKYFQIEFDEVIGDFTYTEVAERDIKYYSSEYNKGELVFNFPRSVYESTEEKPVEGEIKDYKYSYFNNVIEFYKNGKKTGIVDLKGKDVIGKVANYMYYRALNIVSPDATEGYNYVITDENGTVSKYNYSLYKYDIINNTTVELKYNVAIENVKPVYNYTTKSYDSAIITGEEMVNGVAYTDNHEFTYATDKDLNVGFDLTGFELPNNLELLSLDNDLYMVNTDEGGYIIINKDLELINSVSKYAGANIGDNLITIYGGNYYGFTDVSGNVIFEPKYANGYSESGSITFYSGIAYVREYGIEGENKRLLIKNDGTVVKDLNALEESSDPKVEKEVFVGNGYYLLETTTTTPSANVFFPNIRIKYEYFSFDGTPLIASGDLDQYEAVSRFRLSDGSMVFGIPKENAGGGNSTYEYYKLSF